MSIPVRFEVVLNDDSSITDLSFGTESYGADFERINLWKSYFSRVFEMNEKPEWLPEVKYFITPNGFVFTPDFVNKRIIWEGDVKSKGLV